MKWRERIFYLAIIVAVILLFRACERGCQILGFGKSKSDTISVKIDTVFIHLKGDTTYVPKLVGVNNTIHVTKTLHDTLTEYEVRIDPADTQAILQRFYQKAFYEDVVPIKDYGTITVSDTVTQNRIVSRRWKTDLKIPEVTKTITLRDKRTVGYLGISAIGNPEQPLHSIGLDFTLKLKSDYQVGIGANFTKEGKLFYSGQFKTPIRLKRK